MFKVLVAVLRSPSVWFEGARAALATRPAAGLVSSDYLAWRTATAYGSATADVPAQDVVEYLQWRRRQRKLMA